LGRGEKFLIFCKLRDDENVVVVCVGDDDCVDIFVCACYILEEKRERGRQSEEGHMCLLCVLP
jgi:hypothetical protein